MKTLRLFKLAAIALLVASVGGAALWQSRKSEARHAATPRAAVALNDAATASSENLSAHGSGSAPVATQESVLAPGNTPDTSPLGEAASTTESPEAQAIVALWDGANGPSLLQALLQLPEGAARTEGLMRLAALWARTAPNEASEALRRLPPGDERARALGQAISTWATTDPQAAVEWLASGPGSQEGFEVEKATAYSAWAARDPAAASEQALRTGASAESIRAILTAWVQSNPDAAYQFYSKVPASLRPEITSSFLLSAAAVNSDVAVTLMTHLLSESESAGRLAPVGRSLALVDLELAILFEQMLPEGADRERVKSDIDARMLATEDPDPSETGEDTEQDYALRQAAGAGSGSATIQGKTAVKQPKQP